MRPNRNSLQTHLILPLGFGWTSNTKVSPSPIANNAGVAGSEKEEGLLFEQIKML